jgi:predicted nucleic acid-binding protein
MKMALDTNCFINAVHPESQLYTSMQQLLAAYSAGIVQLHVSLHSLHELEQKPDEALILARKLQTLTYWPIGTIKELVGKISQMTGTFGDMRRNHTIQQELECLAKSGNDLRDRGALIDALHASMDFFVTSDKHLVGSGPAERIFKKFHLQIVRPDDAARIIEEGSS